MTVSAWMQYLAPLTLLAIACLSTSHGGAVEPHGGNIDVAVVNDIAGHFEVLAGVAEVR